jgi:hypothetical protein
MSNKIVIQFASDPELDSPSVFLVSIDIPRNDCTIAASGKWVLRISYASQNASGEIKINSTAIGRYSARKYINFDKELNFPLNEINLQGVYWKIQKVMQLRMDSMTLS